MTDPEFQPVWITRVLRVTKDYGPEVYQEDRESDSKYISIPLGSLGSWVALEIEPGPRLSNEHSSYIVTVRAWDRTGGLDSETEVGDFTLDGLEFALPAILAGIAAVAREEVAQENDDARRMCEDDAAFANGGYVNE
jgi:hypothetical protein